MVEIKLLIEYPFENDYIENKYEDFFNRVIADIKESKFKGLCGKYELETAEFLREAFLSSYFHI